MARLNEAPKIAPGCIAQRLMLDSSFTTPQSVVMRFTKWDYIAFPFLAALCIGVFYSVLRLVGFFGLGVLGLVIIFIVIRMDLEKDGPGGVHVLAEQFKARDRMSRSEKSSLFEEQRSRLQPQFVALVTGAGFVILGFGLHFFL